MKKLLPLLVFSVLAFLAGCDRAAVAPAAVALPAASVTTADDAIRTEIEQKTSALRGLTFQKPVDYKMIARAEFKDFLLKKVSEQFTEQEMRNYGCALAALGAIPAGTDLLAVLVSLYDEQVAAFYVPEERALYTFQESTWSGGMDRMLLAHELTHALQDQTYDLTKMPLKEKHNDDLALAAAALLEGDATILMTRYYVENADRSRMNEDLAAMMNQQTGKLAAAPAFLRETLLFPYVQGQQFVQALLDDGGLRALDAAFRRPPTSTEEILHPEIFLRNRTVPAVVNPPALYRPGWEQIANNVLGEFGIRTLLQQEVGAFQAQVAAAGWNGDRYHAYGRADQTNAPVIVVWVTAWDTGEDAAEFVEAYTAFAKKRNLTVTMRRQANEVTVMIGQTEESVEQVRQNPVTP